MIAAAVLPSQHDQCIDRIHLRDANCTTTTSRGYSMIKTRPIIGYFAASASLLCASASYAQTADAPSLQEGDAWVYQATEEQNTAGILGSTTKKWDVAIVRSGSKTMVISAKAEDSNLPPKELLRNADWAVVQNINGKNTVTNRPYDFPLKPGKTWKVEYDTANPDARTKVQHITKNYTVLGWVDIKVPAGTYHAIKVEMEGEWSKEFNPTAAVATSTVTSTQAGSVAISASRNASTQQSASGRMYDAFRYVPELKTHVKLITENYQAGGALNKRVTEELAASPVH
ncbi:hypothetical protein [Herbaspirillum huttiense]|uniref:hypothetical protein n=1 Tax=Herbaspirillum huttiense TaxID=863372 RepID=UPI002E793E3C|nr:hypothetical protein [Herbaspirillum huttiense]MEE1638887.1 hypothetical protein [Herbaspirillum huttiense NC40101]